MKKEKLELHKRLQGFYKEKMGVLQIGDMFYNPFRNKLYFADKETVIIDGCYVLPLPIDPVNPERGLWGMLNKNFKWELSCFWEGDTLFHSVARIPKINDTLFYYAPDPETALLKALCAQENL